MKRSNPFVLFALLAVLAMPAFTHADNTVAPNTLPLGLGGYSPVSYFQHDRPHVGSPKFQASHAGVTYFFASEAERKTFLADPAKYAPGYGGWCAYGMAVEGKFQADPTNYKIINGVLYVFLKNADVDTLALWNDGDQAQLCAKAETFWGTLNAPVSRAYTGSQNIGADGVALSGYSPVSYFTEHKAQKGDPRFTAEHGGVAYHFTSAKQVETFKKDPGRYAPQYGGWCAFGMSVQDKFPIDPTAFKVIDDKLYVFLRNAQIDAHQLWNKGNQPELLEKSAAHWAKVSGK